MSKAKASAQTSEERKVALHVLHLLESGALKPCDRLPAERKLAEDVGVSRAHVRGAIQRLEIYGIVKTYPQSGTVLADHTVTVLMNQIHNILEIDGFDFYSLVQVRILLEAEAIRLCAVNRDEADIVAIRAALDDYLAHFDTPLRDEKDFAYHLVIARASHNPVISSLLLTITPDVLKYYRSLGPCDNTPTNVAREHEAMLDCIVRCDPDGAEQCIRAHFKAISAFSGQYRDNHIPRTRI